MKISFDNTFSRTLSKINNPVTGKVFNNIFFNRCVFKTLLNTFIVKIEPMTRENITYDQEIHLLLSRRKLSLKVGNYCNDLSKAVQRNIARST